MSRQREVNEYLDRRLPPRARSAFESRLAEDPGLAAEVRSTRSLVDLLRQMPPESAPDGLVTGVMAELRAEPAPVVRPWLNWLNWLDALRPPRLAFAAAALMLLVGVQVTLQDDVRPLELSAADQAFVEDCLQDYHYQAAASLAANGRRGEATPVTLEF